MIYNNIFEKIQQYSDHETIEHILQGNTALFEILIRRYNPFLYKTGRAYGYSHHDTEDLMQETFINVYQSLSKFQNRSSFKTWIIKIMLHQCYHKSRKYSYQKEKAMDVPGNNNKSKIMFLNKNHSDPGKSIVNKELSHIIETALSKLPEEYRMTFTLRELTGLNVAETAALMNVTTSNVKVRLNRAKIMLRKEIEDIYTPEDIYEFNLIYCNKIVDAVMSRISE
ncbi:MAG: sigma-70 family RNA polymerase sigma factor [Ginsengibacter sp.]